MFSERRPETRSIDAGNLIDKDVGPVSVFRSLFKRSNVWIFPLRANIVRGTDGRWQAGNNISTAKGVPIYNVGPIRKLGGGGGNGVLKDI